jgi:hypothetical protein
MLQRNLKSDNNYKDMWQRRSGFAKQRRRVAADAETLLTNAIVFAPIAAKRQIAPAV